MKRLIIGISILISGILVYSSNLIAAALYSSVLLDTSWNQNLGIFNTALAEVSLIPTFLAIIFIVIGLIIVIIELLDNKKRFY